MLKHWCSFDIQGLVGAGINDASNALLLKQELHDWFGKFGFWFEPVCYHTYQGQPFFHWLTDIRSQYIRH